MEDKFSKDNDENSIVEQTPVNGEQFEEEQFSALSETKDASTTDSVNEYSTSDTKTKQVEPGNAEAVADTKVKKAGSEKEEVPVDFEVKEAEIGENVALDDSKIKIVDTVEKNVSDNITEETFDKDKKKSKFTTYKVIRILCMVGFVVFLFLFINEVVIQPIKIKKSVDLARELYDTPTAAPSVTASPIITAAPKVTEAIQATPTPDPNRDEKGRLLQFKKLLKKNEDVAGWIKIPDTNIDYVVMQSGKENPNYYLDKDINKEYSKAGTLYLDIQAPVERNTSIQNYVIYGHNMVSTAEKMFHYILKYKNGVSYYKEHPVISFDTIYNTGKWKIFAVFITNGSSKKEPLFDYRTSTFKTSSDFLNFVYQLRVRSVLNIDSVDINENDQLLMLSTCSYEVDNDYRTVIVARKVREGEDATVDVDSATINPNPLYPNRYYKKNGGEAPEISTFEKALADEKIKWYSPVDNDKK